MKLFKYLKDGGPASKVSGYFLIEWKSLFSVVLLRFENGSREAYHTHAFNAISWVLSGELTEYVKYSDDGDFRTRTYTPSIFPVFTQRHRMHKVVSTGTTWALTFRGPWNPVWQEFLPKENKYINLTHGRRTLT